MQGSDILVLGGLFPDEMEMDVLKNSRGSLEFAASAHLKMILAGLDKNLESPVTLLNLLPVGSYPRRYRRLCVCERAFSHAPGAADTNIGYTNLTVYKKFSRYKSLCRHASAWAKSAGPQQKFVIIYSLLECYFKAAKAVRRVRPDAVICVICCDLPQFTDIDKPRHQALYALRAKRREAYFLKAMRLGDCFVFLTEAMNGYFGLQKPYLVMEGLVDEQAPGDVAACDPGGKTGGEKRVLEKESLKYIAYTGTFTKKYGIMGLLDAFALIDDPSFRLVLCGSGEARRISAAARRQTERILFLGSVPRAEALTWQRRATILVNPRTSEGEFTKYSFPSKLMEYLSSGRPVLCFHLPGIGAEYDEYLSYFSGENPAQMAQDMLRLCQMPAQTLNEMGARGQSFVLREKNNRTQGKRLLDLLLQAGQAGKAGKETP